MDVAWIELSLEQIVILLTEIRDLLKKEDEQEVLELLEQMNEKLNQLVELLQENNILLTEVGETCQEILAKIKKK